MFESIEFDNNRVTLIYSGTVTFEEIIDANKRIINHPFFPKIDQQLWLFKSIEKFNVDVNKIERIIATAINKTATHENLKIAIVSKSDLAFGLGRMYEALSENTPWQTMVFRTIDKAEEWLNA